MTAVCSKVLIIEPSVAPVTVVSNMLATSALPLSSGYPMVPRRRHNDSGSSDIMSCTYDRPPMWVRYFYGTGLGVLAGDARVQVHDLYVKGFCGDVGALSQLFSIHLCSHRYCMRVLSSL